MQKEQQSMTVDLENRDPNNLNSHVRATFEEVLGEPDGTHSMDCVWRNSYSCFNCSKACCYNLMTLLCGICIAFYWGFDFAITTFNHVWCITPWMRSFSITLGTCQKWWGTCCNCLVAPVCAACGAYFSNMRLEHIKK